MFQIDPEWLNEQRDEYLQDLLDDLDLEPRFMPMVAYYDQNKAVGGFVYVNGIYIYFEEDLDEEEMYLIDDHEYWSVDLKWRFRKMMA